MQTINNFIEAQQVAGLQASTINRRLASLASFFDYLSLEAEADDWLNPVRWKQHRLQPGRHLPRDVTDKQAEALLAIIQEPRDRAIFTLMLRAGLRVGEVVALNLDDVEAPGGHNLARLRVCGKGQKERIAWLTADGWLEVQSWMALRPASQEPALFLNQHGQRLSVAGVQYRLKQYTTKTGEALSCHQLRHTYARRLAERDMPLDSLAKLMGHSSLQTTQLYIDGADPVVRRDFAQAMQHSVHHSAPDVVQVEAKSGTIPSVKPVERPEPQTILQQLAYLTAELPAWLQQPLAAHMLRRMSRWATQHLYHHSYRQLNVLRRICSWLVQQRQWTALADLQRLDLLAYVDHRLDHQVKASSINAELAVFYGFWRGLIEREQVSNGAILLVKASSTAKPLPRYLSPEQFQRLQAALQAQTVQDRPTDRFDLAWFYLLAHAGLRSVRRLTCVWPIVTLLAAACGSMLAKGIGTGSSP